MKPALVFRVTLLASFIAASSSALAFVQDWTIPAGQTQVYDTASGPLQLDNLTIQAGATLRVVGDASLRLNVRQSIVIAGRLDLSAFNSPGVVSINTTTIPELGSAGLCGGGRGGTGNPVFTASCPAGGDGFGAYNDGSTGGRGGESGFNPVFTASERRAAGGGGGALGRAQPVHPDPLNPSNIGLIPSAGHAGSPTALGALSQNAPPQGGAAGPLLFVDADPDNDFWGVKLDPFTLQLTFGELARPRPGTGGGAGGNSSQSAVFPMVPFDPIGDEKGAGGAGGGGLGLILARHIRIQGAGRITANGGNGGGGENTNLLNRIGGGSGGGSGGYLVLQAYLIDLSAANANCITALGGRGGPGANNVLDAIGAGGNGGPGVIQLHALHGMSDIRLPATLALDDLTSPNAHVLLPILEQ